MVNDYEPAVIEREAEFIQELTNRTDFLLAAVKVDIWNEDLSPWPAPPVFGNKPFGDKAEDTLAFLLEELIPSIPGDSDVGTRMYYIGGYSLAGLFALWAAYQTHLFAGVAAASPSVWFPGFREYVKENRIQTGAVYLSLGDKEEKTRNAVMSQVGDAIREIDDHYRKNAIPCFLEWNPGNHFREPELRMAKGFAWLMNRQRK